MDNRELQQHLCAARAGDPAAFERVYRELAAPVYAVAYRITGDRALSEDVLQEAFVKLYRLPEPADVRRPRAYLFQMARNLAIDGARAARRTEPLEDAAGAVPQTWEDGALRMDLERAMAALEPVQRQIVTLHLNAGLKFREIAEVLEIPIGTALWRYRKAMEALREELSRE